MIFRVKTITSIGGLSIRWSKFSILFPNVQLAERVHLRKNEETGVIRKKIKKKFIRHAGMIVSLSNNISMVIMVRYNTIFI